MATSRQNTEAFEAELKKRIQEGVYRIICLCYGDQEEKPPMTQAPDFTLEQQSDLDIEKIDKTWENTAYLFFAQEMPDCCKTSEEAKKFFASLNKNSKKKYGRNCMPQVNAGHFEKPEKPHKYGRCLYVGSCEKNIQTRMKHHLGKLSGAFGLHLGEWWKKNPIQIFFLVFADNIAGEYLGLVKDALWDECKPLFGKRGPGQKNQEP
jgi:hypothetical protein